MEPKITNEMEKENVNDKGSDGELATAANNRFEKIWQQEIFVRKAVLL